MAGVLVVEVILRKRVCRASGCSRVLSSAATLPLRIPEPFFDKSLRNFECPWWRLLVSDDSSPGFASSCAGTHACALARAPGASSRYIPIDSGSGFRCFCALIAHLLHELPHGGNLT